MATIPPASDAEALRRLTAADPPQWLTPNAELSTAARAAGRHLFSSLRPYASSKSSFERLLTENFDHEQIWQQIDLQSQPLVSSLRREVKRFQKDQEEIRKIRASEAEKEEKMEAGDFGEELKKLDEDMDELEEESDEEEMEESEDEPEALAEEGDNNGGPIEDKFLKIKDLEDFLEDEDAREYGDEKEAEEDEDDDDDDEEDEEDELGEFGFDDDEDGEDDTLGNARYDDFFGAKAKAKPSKKKPKLLEDSGDSASDEEKEEEDDEIPKMLSTYEKEQMKNRSKIEQMERENMEPKSWTMQGEVTAAKRPKNSALEVELDFQHNVGPPPVITEEVTASLEEMIKNRIVEGIFDDVRKAASQPTKARREVKELDENKSKKGLGEVMEEEFVTTSTGFAPITFAEEQKKEASLLFKKLCLKLDALSHFHFTPKPVIEDMAIPTNVPALAIEEIAPLAVSDAAMLAPEEVFAGKGDIKEDVELSQAERKRRRASKKRKFKAETEKKMANKPRDSTPPNNKEEAEKITTTKSRDSS